LKRFLLLVRDALHVSCHVVNLQRGSLEHVFVVQRPVWRGLKIQRL
jgi:hypothetical protein